jgi:hypothetical protein
MAVKDWSTTANSNTTIDSINIAEGAPFANMNNMGRAIMANVREEIAAMGDTITAAGTATISGASQFKPMDGNTTITAFDTAVTGLYREVRVMGTPKIIASAAIVTPDGLDYQAAPDDLLRLRSLGAGNWFMAVDRKTGQTSMGKHLIPFGAGSMVAATTNGPSRGQVETTTHKINYLTWDFDGTTSESAWINFQAPTSADESRGFTFEADWGHSLTATGAGVAFTLSMLAVSDGDAIDTAMGTAVTVTDSKLGTDKKHTTAESATVTPAGTWAAGDWIFAKFSRLPSDAADLMTVDAQVMGVRMFLYTNAATDVAP